MIQEELKLNFGGGCIFDHFIIPENDNWIFEMKKEQEKKKAEDIKRLVALFDEYKK